MVKVSKWATPYRVIVLDRGFEQIQQSWCHWREGNDFDVTLVDDEAALKANLKSESYDVVLLDCNSPQFNAPQLAQYIREELGDHFLQVIMLSDSNDPLELCHCLDIGANDFIRKPYSEEELWARVAAAGNHRRMTDQLDTAESMLFALARMVEAKDVCTGDHCARLSHASVVFGRELDLSEPELLALYRGGVLHDLGKLGIPDNILLKRGALTDDEWQVMRQHTTIGAHLCAGLKSVAMAVPIIQYHHERWDGSGYPDGLKGEEIPLLARIFQVVDIYDALMSERPYKPALPQDEVVRIMEEEAGKGWLDPNLVNKFLNIVRCRPESLRVPEKMEAQLGSNIFDEIIKTGVLDWDKPYEAEKLLKSS